MCLAATTAMGRAGSGKRCANARVLKDGLGEEGNQSITAPLRRNFQVDDVLLLVRVEDEMHPHVPGGGRPVNSPARFPENVREDTLEFVAGSDAAIRDRHTASPSHGHGNSLGHVSSHGHGKSAHRAACQRLLRSPW